MPVIPLFIAEPEQEPEPELEPEPAEAAAVGPGAAQLVGRSGGDATAQLLPVS